jgi:hypothetical protein
MAAVTLTLFAMAYVGSVVTGRVADQRKIDAVTLTVIVLAGVAAAVLWNPQAFSRLTLFEMGSFRLELANVRKRQAEQADQLQSIRLLLPLLLTVREQKHLMNLSNRATDSYLGNNDVRTELRRLRSIGLIEMREGKNVGKMADGLKFDLSEFVRLTKLGNEWVGRIQEIAKAEAANRDLNADA